MSRFWDNQLVLIFPTLILFDVSHLNRTLNLEFVVTSKLSY